MNRHHITESFSKIFLKYKICTNSYLNVTKVFFKLTTKPK